MCVNFITVPNEVLWCKLRWHFNKAIIIIVIIIDGDIPRTGGSIG